MCFGIEFYKYYSCSENYFINIILILKAFSPIFSFFFTFCKESSDALKMKLCISRRNLSVFSVVYSWLLAPQSIRKLMQCAK